MAMPTIRRRRRWRTSSRLIPAAGTAVRPTPSAVTLCSTVRRPSSSASSTQRLPRRARGVRVVPSGSDRGRRTIDHGNRRDAVGRGELQQRYPQAVQELPVGRGLYPRWRSPRSLLSPTTTSPKEEYAKARDPSFAFDKILSDKELARGALATLYPLAHLDTWCRRATSSACSSAAGAISPRQFPEIGLPNPDRPASSGWRSRAGQTCKPVEPWPRHRACVPRSRCSTSTRPGSTIRSPGSWAPTNSRATIAIRAVHRATSIYANDREPRHSA